MVRKAGSRNKSTGCRFKSYEGEYSNDKHVRMTWNMIYNKIFKELSPNAKVLYLYMKASACGNETVNFAESMTNDIMTRTTHRKARDELVKKEFIVYLNKHRARDMKETAKYQFSNGWYDKNQA